MYTATNKNSSPVLAFVSILSPAYYCKQISYWQSSLKITNKRQITIRILAKMKTKQVFCDSFSSTISPNVKIKKLIFVHPNYFRYSRRKVVPTLVYFILCTRKYYAIFILMLKQSCAPDELPIAYS